MYAPADLLSASRRIAATALIPRRLNGSGRASRISMHNLILESLSNARLRLFFVEVGELKLRAAPKVDVREVEIEETGLLAGALSAMVLA